MNWIRALLDAVMPERARSVHMRSITALPLSPHTIRLGGVSITALAPYADSRVREAITSLKFDNNKDAQRLCAQLFDAYCTSLRERYEHIVLIPIPLSAPRMRARGYNQVERMLTNTEAVQSGFAFIDTTSLVRVHDTLPQTSLPKDMRLKNVRGAFAYHPPKTKRVHPVILVDDVITTGATLSEALRAVSVHESCNAIVLSFAHQQAS